VSRSVLELLKERDDRWFWDDHALPGWRVSWRFGVLKNGAYAVKELHINRKLDPDLFERWTATGDIRLFVEMFYTPGQGLTPRLLRQLRFGAPTARTKRLLAKARRQMHVKAKAGEKEKRGRPRVYSRAWYEELARRYEKAPIKKALAREYRMKPSAMRAAIYRCRHAQGLGFLDPTKKGTASP
jgi:hypothetical protein